MLLKDLFCGMDVETETAAASFVFEGKVYYFCDIACKQMFALDPQKYILLDEGKRKDERI